MLCFLVMNRAFVFSSCKKYKQAQVSNFTKFIEKGNFTKGLRHGPDSNKGSSGESWTMMGENPIQQYRVSEEGCNSKDNKASVSMPVDVFLVGEVVVIMQQAFIK